MTSEARTEAPVVQAWQRIVVLSALLIAITLALLPFLIGEMIVPIFIFAVVFAVIAGLLWRFGAGRRWPWIVAAVLSVLALLGDIEFLIHDFSHPEEFAIFVSNVIVVAGVALIAVGGYVIGRRGNLAVRPVLLGTGAVVALLTVFSLVSALALEKHDQEPGDILFIADRFEFPERLELSAGPQWVFLENRDRFRHTFVIDDPFVKVDMPGSTGRRAQIDLAPGEYEFYCDVPGHESMVGTLVVTASQVGQ